MSRIPDARCGENPTPQESGELPQPERGHTQGAPLITRALSSYRAAFNAEPPSRFSGLMEENRIQLLNTAAKFGAVGMEKFRADTAAYGLFIVARCSGVADLSRAADTLVHTLARGRMTGADRTRLVETVSLFGAVWTGLSDEQRADPWTAVRWLFERGGGEASRGWGGAVSRFKAAGAMMTDAAKALHEGFGATPRSEGDALHALHAIAKRYGVALPCCPSAIADALSRKADAMDAQIDRLTEEVRAAKKAPVKELIVLLREWESLLERPAT